MRGPFFITFAIDNELQYHLAPDIKRASVTN